MSSRERMLAAIKGESDGVVPCSFMIFRALQEKCRGGYEFIERQMAMGLDARVELDDLPVRLSEKVAVSEEVTVGTNDGSAILTRRYETPRGVLTSSIKQLEGWPFGNRLPLFSDFITPRAVEHPVTGPNNIDALRYLFQKPLDEDISCFLARAAQHKRFADRHGLLLSGGWRSNRAVPDEDPLLIGAQFSTVSVVDTLMWLCGGTAPLLWAYDDPGFLSSLIELIAAWNRDRLKIHLDAGAELVLRRAWYEGTDFWSPPLYREFILPTLRQDVSLAHEAGAKYGYIITSGMMPIADMIVEAGVDVIIGIDPSQGKGTDLTSVRQSLGGRIGLWGGVSGPLVVEEGSEREVQAAVEDAIAILGDTNRFILSPVDNIRADTRQTWRNVDVFVQTWRSLTRPGS